MVSTRRVERVCKSRVCTISICVGLLAAMWPVGGAVARDHADESHCVVDVSGGTAIGAGCFESLRAAHNSISDTSAISKRSAGVFAESRVRSSSVVGVHFKGSELHGILDHDHGVGMLGFGLETVGGRGTTTSSRATSIAVVRPPRFYDSSSCSGSHRPIRGSATTLGWMNNRASCVRYG